MPDNMSQCHVMVVCDGGVCCAPRLVCDGGVGCARRAQHIAAAEGNRKMVESLLNRGCRADAKDRWGNTPQQDAERAGHGWPNSIWLGTAAGSA